MNNKLSRNQYVVDASPSKARDESRRKDRFFSLRFTLALRHRGDVCYVAYHFPYGASLLRVRATVIRG